MSKILVKLHEGILLDLAGKQTIEAIRPQVVESTRLVQEWIARGRATVLAQLKDNASQEALEKAYKNSKTEEAAVKAFLKDYALAEEEPKKEGEKAEEPKKEGEKAEEPKKEGEDNK
jgi:hypothetical protein